MKLDIAYAPSASTTFWQRGQTTWPEICAWVVDPRRDGRKDGPGYMLGKLSSNRRTRDTVVSRSVLALDADHLTQEMLFLLMGRIRALHVPAVVYSTFSSTADEPRIRILILPDRSMTPDEYWTVCHFLMNDLGWNAFDHSSAQAERLMYMPSVGPAGNYFYEVIEGSAPLRVDEVLDVADIVYAIPQRDAGPDVLDLPDRVVPDRPVPDEVINDQVASALRGLDGLAALAEGERLPWPGMPDGIGWDMGTLFMAERLIEAANSGGSYTIELAMMDFMEHAPESGGSYDREHKWRQAVKWVGRRPIPYMGAADVFDAVPGPLQPAESSGQVLDADVAKELRRLQVVDAARELHRRAKEPKAAPFDLGSLRDVLSRPEEPAMRVEGLIPADASTLLSAMRKTGKTTMSLNLILSLLTGDPFLGRFATRPVDGNVAIMNYEVSGMTLARWASEMGIPDDKLFLVNLRGRRNPLNHAEDRNKLAQWLRERSIESLFVDPFGRAFTGTEQNDAGQVGAFLSDLDTFARDEVGAHDLVLTAHAGWQGERTRGSSALEDWPDSILTMTRSEDDPAERYLSAMGRDVELSEDKLVYDVETRKLSLAGSGSRKAAKLTLSAFQSDGNTVEETQAAIIEALRDAPLSGNELSDFLLRKDTMFTNVRNQMVDDGLLIKSPRGGRGGGFLYSLNVVDEQP